MPYKNRDHMKGYQASHYQRNKLEIRTRLKKRRMMFRKVVNELRSNPCMDCGKTFPPVCMDFDHRPGEVKFANISQLARYSSEEKLRTEIAKCDLVCACCHRIRTQERMEGSVIKLQDHLNDADAIQAELFDNHLSDGCG